MFDYVGVGLLLLVTALFAWLTGRARRLRRVPLKWAGLAAAGLLTLLGGTALVTALVGFSRLNATHSNPVREINVAGTPAQLARGQKLANACSGCHSPNNQLPLSGQDFTAGGPPFGTLHAANLTPAGLGTWSDGEIARAIREGVHKNGRSLVIMPSMAFQSMSDADVQSLIAFLRTQPAVEPDTPPTQINLLGALIAATEPGLLTAQPPLIGPIEAPAEGVTPAYGQYLSTISGCTECHGATFAGNPNGPEGPVPAINKLGWSEEQFIATMRSGVTPDGRALGESMPIKDFKLYSDEDFRAIYAQIRTLSPATAAAP